MTPQEVEAVARQLEGEGYFDRVRQGSDRAASYFARLVAYRCNPHGDPSLPGCLRKGGGKNIDGYAEDAIALTGDPHDLHNVMDLVAGAGGAGASVRAANVNPRRPEDTWEAPRPLAPSELAELGKSGGQTPAPPAAGWNPATHGVLLARLAAAGITDTQRIAEQFAFSFPAEGWGQKRAADNRPISNNVIARQEPFVGYQVVPASMNPTTYDLRGQVFVPVLPVNHVFEAPAPSPEPPPPPPPTPTPPPAADLAAVLAELKALREEVNALVAREFPDYEGTVNAFGNELPITLKVAK